MPVGDGVKGGEGRAVYLPLTTSTEGISLQARGTGGTPRWTSVRNINSVRLSSGYYTLNDRPEEWQFYYKLYRQHSSLQGKTPMDVVCTKSALTPFWENIEAKYDPVKEPIREQSYRKCRNLAKFRKKALLP